MSAWIDSLNALSAAWLDLLLRASWQGAIALALIWLIARYVSHLPAAHKVWLWRLAFLKLLAGLIWLSPVVLPILPQRTPVIPVAEAISMTVAPAETTVEVPLPAVTIEPTPSSLHPSGWLFLAWCGGLLVCALRVLRHWRATRRLLRGGRSLGNPAAEESVRALCGRLRRGRPPSISESSALSSPVLVGIFRPRIILPRGLADSASPARLELMIAHELAHLRRRDLLWLWLFTLGETLFFFHPLVWLARREWNLATEAACDEMAIRLTRQTPRDYGEMLVDIVAGISRNPTPLVAVGMIENANTLKRRLKLMITTRTRFASIGGIALICVATLALVPWKLAAQDADAETVAKLKEENAKLRQELEAMRRDAEKRRADGELRNRVEAVHETALQRELAERNAQVLAERNAQVARNLERQKRDMDIIRVEQQRMLAIQQSQAEKLQAELDELRARFKDHHPLVRERQAQLEKLEAAIDATKTGRNLEDPLETRRDAAMNERAMRRQEQQKQQEQQEQQRALLQKEVELAERHVEFVRKAMENGKETPASVLIAQRELLEVKLQLARLSNSKADQRAVLLQQLNAAERLLKEQKTRVEVGTVQPGAEIPFEREVLRIKRQLHEFEDSDARE